MIFGSGSDQNLYPFEPYSWETKETTYEIGHEAQPGVFEYWA